MGHGDVMRSSDAQYRFRIAQGFLEESRQDVALTRWRSAVDSAQLATENAAKTVLALVGPVGRTHQPALLLRQALQIFSPSYQQYVERLSEQAEMLGFDVHVQTDYGDEMEGVTPWELFNEDDARSALAIAEEAVRLAQLIIEALNQ
jgi:HEPN domain-containing protein